MSGDDSAAAKDEFANVTAAVATSSAEPGEPQPEDDIDGAAVEDSGDMDPDLVQLQKSLSRRRRQQRTDTKEPLIQKILPFPFLPNIRPLTISDLDSCVALEEAAFHRKEHRASPEKFQYRLTTCSELSLGLFCTVVPSQVQDFEIETLSAARPVETDRADGGVSVLLAHIVSTRSCSDVVTDDDMDYPRDWRSRGGRSSGVGYQEEGRTLAIHSLAVSPKLQGCGLGKMLLKAYLQQMNNSGTADRVALLCEEHLITYYKRFGFACKGASKATFGGGSWFDMGLDLVGPPKTPF